MLQMFDMGTGDDPEEVLVEGVPPESYLERFQVQACGMKAWVVRVLSAEACGSLPAAWLSYVQTRCSVDHAQQALLKYVGMISQIG